MPAFRLRLASPLASISLLLAACGGGGSTEGTAPLGSAASPPGSSVQPAAAVEVTPMAGPDLLARSAAAATTAGSTANDCFSIRPFYWELGDGSGARAGDSVARPGSGRGVSAQSELRLASASKWLYAAYVAQRRGGRLEPLDERMLSLRSGYVDFAGCQAGQTVQQCLAWQNNDRFSADADGRFWYGGGHLQKHASLIGLGDLDAAGLAAEWRSWLGEDLKFGMSQARPGGGATGTPAAYAAFLRKLLRGELALAGLLGTGAVCTGVDNCNAGATPFASGHGARGWHYSLGHWVEDDAAQGDGAFSSAGAFGFYPWIAADRSHYGIVAREVRNGGSEDGIGAGAESARCGRLIRRAWLTGVAQ
jgi:hypothetical protein